MRSRRRLDKHALLIYGALVVVHALMGVRRSGPFFFGDEWGYLGAARYLAVTGAVPNMGRAMFYHVGYPLFLTPAYRLFPPDLVYVGVMVTNALLLPTVFLALVVFLRRVLQLDAARARWIALAGSLYPAIVLQSKIAWAESLLIPLFAWTVVSIHELGTHRTPAWGLMLGSGVALLYVAHGRMLPVLPVAAFVVILMARRIRLPAQSIACTALAFITVLGVGTFLNVHVRGTTYHPAVSISDTFAPSTKLGLQGISWFSFEAIGQLWYLAAATFGLVVLGLVAAAQLALRGERPATRLTAWFLLAASAGAFALSAYYMMTRRGAHHAIYGRYNEGVLAPFLALGMASLVRARTGAQLGRGCLIAVSSLVLLAVLLPLGPGAERLENEPIVTPNVIGIVHAISFFGGLHVVATTLLAAGTLVVVTVIAWRHRMGGLVLVALIFATFSTHTYFSRSLGNRGTRLSDFITVVEQRRLKVVAYDSAYRKRGFWEYQFWLENTSFRTFNSRIENPPNPFVITAPIWPEGERCRARKLAEDPKLEQALWVVGDKCAEPPPVACSTSSSKLSVIGRGRTKSSS